MMFRQNQHSAIQTAQLEELRREDSRRVLERECRTLRRQFTALEKEHRALRAGHEAQCQRLDSMVVQSGALLTLINHCGDGIEDLDRPHRRGGKREAVEGDKNQQIEALEAGNRRLIEDRALLLRRNAELELQVETVMKQFGSLLVDYEETRGKLDELKRSVAAATLAGAADSGGGWERL